MVCFKGGVKYGVLTKCHDFLKYIISVPGCHTYAPTVRSNTEMVYNFIHLLQMNLSNILFVFMV
jgi:hypothetical protein